jgi:hypothetical protein
MSTTWNIRNIPPELAKRVKVYAVERGLTLKDVVVSALEGVLGGDDERSAEGGERKNHGETGSVAGRGTGNLQSSGEGSGGLRAPESGRANLRGLRGDVSGHPESEGRGSGSGAGEVLEPHDGTQPVSRAVGDGARIDSGEQIKMCLRHGQVMRDFGVKWVCLGPPAHSEMK